MKSFTNYQPKDDKILQCVIPILYLTKTPGGDPPFLRSFALILEINS